MGVMRIGGGTDASELVLAAEDGAMARVLWFGPGEQDDGSEDAAALVGNYAPTASHHDAATRAVPLLPGPAHAWPGRAALSGHRADGSGWLTEFAVTAISGAAGRGVTSVDQSDDTTGLRLRTEFEALAGGAIRVRHTLTNDGGPYTVDQLDVVLPVPDRCTEQLDLTGRWARERIAQRRPIADGVWLREGRTGKPGPEAPTLLTAMTAGTGFRSGQAWGIHPAWSGNCRYWLERLPDGRIVLGAGEALLPGELVLATGQSYATPWVYLVAGAGLDALAAQLHAHQRTLPSFPTGQPVTLNVWEAVYFDHDLDRLGELAALGAEVGVERFVLDDGWFGSRRDDASGLGDWTVSPDVWPDGLQPLIDVVHRHGLEFGLWFEPEMVNPDSELYRAHPDWVLGDRSREPRVFRNQLVLDLGRQEVRQYLFDAIDAVLSRYDIGYVKWDHNRYLYDGAGAAGRAGVHAQTLGFYDLLDRLRQAHPSVAWESCASGGARIDLGVIERSERFWTSDSTDALTRQDLQRWSTQLIAPAYLGAHVSAPLNHQTGRRFSLDFRAATAFFGAMGIEWDLTAATPEQRARLAEWIAAHKRHRSLLHGGTSVRVDTPTEQIRIHGVVAEDRAEAIFGYAQLDERVADPVAFLVPGLDPRRRYRIERVCPDGTAWAGDGLEASGSALARIGLPAPGRMPESEMVVHLRAV